MARTWSVEIEANSWMDDLFNGAYDECVEYCKKHDYKIDGAEGRLAQVEIDEDGIVVDCLDIVNEL